MTTITNNTDDKNILYGGPDVDLIDNTSKSLGEVILQKLAENGNEPMFVSILTQFKQKVWTNALFIYSFVWTFIKYTITKPVEVMCETFQMLWRLIHFFSTIFFRNANRLTVSAVRRWHGWMYVNVSFNWLVRWPHNIRCKPVMWLVYAVKIAWNFQLLHLQCCALVLPWPRWMLPILIVRFFSCKIPILCTHTQTDIWFNNTFRIGI